MRTILHLDEGLPYWGHSILTKNSINEWRWNATDFLQKRFAEDAESPFPRVPEHATREFPRKEDRVIAVRDRPLNFTPFLKGIGEMYVQPPTVVVIVERNDPFALRLASFHHFQCPGICKLGINRGELLKLVRQRRMRLLNSPPGVLLRAPKIKLPIELFPEGRVIWPEDLLPTG